MATSIRPEISIRNKYWIDKHRHYELKHFCLQYPVWKQEYVMSGEPSIASSVAEKLPSTNIPGDPTAKLAMRRAGYLEKMRMIENAALEADNLLHDYILKGVTEGLSYTYLKSKMNLPCGKDTYYDRYRRFFWILSNTRN